VLRGGQDLDNIWEALAAANLRPDQATGIRVVDGMIHLPLIAPVKTSGRSPAEVEEDARTAYRALAPWIGLTLAPGPASERSDLGFSGSILPDGSLTLPLIGPVRAAGLTVEDFNRTLVQRYASAIPAVHPRVDVLVLRGDQDVVTVWSALVAANQRNDQAAEVAVLDGRIHLPLIPPMEAANKTLAEAQATASEAYRRLAPGISVTLSPGRQRERTCAILGEVRIPGRFQIVRGIPLLAAIAQAGGFTDRANLSQVVVATPRGDGVTDVHVVDLGDSVAGRDGAGMLVLKSGSVVFVPRTRIADLNKFVQEYIRNMLPVNVGVGYSLTDQVNFVGSGP